MIYGNDDPMALLAMERSRTGNYGEGSYGEDYEEQCPVCGAYDPESFYVNDDDECVGCTVCLYEVNTLLEV